MTHTRPYLVAIWKGVSGSGAGVGVQTHTKIVSWIWPKTEMISLKETLSTLFTLTTLANCQHWQHCQHCLEISWKPWDTLVFEIPKYFEINEFFRSQGIVKIVKIVKSENWSRLSKLAREVKALELEHCKDCTYCIFGKVPGIAVQSVSWSPRLIVPLMGF